MSERALPARLALETWRFRQRVELAVAQRFARLGRALERFGAPDALRDMADDAARDEARHALLCAELVAHLGGATNAAETALPGLIASAELGDPAALMREIVALSCVVESVSAAALATMREQARDRTVRDVVHEVLRDEIAHARLGWAYLAWLRDARRADGGVAELAALLPALFARVFHDELFAPGSELAPEHAPALHALGVLSRPERRRVVSESLEQVVLPGLRVFGVDTGAAERWLAQASSL